MKNILTLILILVFNSQCFSQTKKQEYSLKADSPIIINKNGKAVWSVKTTLSNNSKDTLYYFSTTCSEAAYYSVDTSALYVDFQSCDTDAQIVIKINPGGYRTLNLDIAAHNSATAPISFRIFMFIHKAKNINDHKLIETMGIPSVMISSDLIKT